MSDRERTIVHVVPILFGEDGCYGGAERYALELARAMSRRVRTVLLSFGVHPFERMDGDLRIKVIRNWFPYRRLRFDPVNPLLVTELAQADVIHYHQSYTSMASVALLYALAARKPIFATPLGGNGLSLHRLADIDGWYDGQLHISQFSVKAYGHARSSRAEVILGGVDTEKFSPDASEPRGGEALFAGRLLPHKGINYLVEGVDATQPLRVLGRPWRHAQRFAEDLHSLAEGKAVTFEEDADDARLVQAYRRALCIVLPSVHRTVYGEHHNVPELLGQTLLEGMACGAPALTTDVASLPEVVEDGVTGFVVPPNDAAALGNKIRWLREHPDEARAMGQAARERVLRLFTWDAVVDRCLSAYERRTSKRREGRLTDDDPH